MSQDNTAYVPQHQLRQRIVVAFVGLLLIALAGWLALIIVTRIDDLFFPGQSLPVGGLGVLPLVQGSGDEQGHINFLVMGLDRRSREGNIATRTDTMFVLTIDKKTKATGILGIPRDLWVDIPTKDGSGVYQQRINTAYAAGVNEGYSGGGASLVKQVVERNLGIPIDHYIVVDFQGFIKVIDDLGGVDVYVEQQVDDPFYSETELPGDYHPLHFKIGQQHMNGQTALDYSRTRFDSSDLDRIHRQQQVIFAAIDKATQLRPVSVSSLKTQWQHYKGAIATDLNDIQAFGLAPLATQIDPKAITALSLGPATVPYTTPEGAEVLLIDKNLVQQIVAALFTGQQIAANSAAVELQNGSSKDDLAGQVAAYLAEFGFSSDSVHATSGTAASQALTEIIDFTGKDSTAQRVASLLGVPAGQIRPATVADRARATVTNVDLLVVLGKDVQGRNFGVRTSSSSP